MWFDWIDKFSNEITNSRDISDQLKKGLLKLILDKIVVEYDHKEKVHKLTINFKIPVYIRDNERGRPKSTQVIVNPIKSGRKPKDQTEPVENYSTVTDFARLRG